MFSDIVQRFDTTLNALYRERDARRAKGQKIIDLVSGNVNRAGFAFPPAILKQALAEGIERARIYAPDPLGQMSARKAIQSYYQKEGLTVPASQILLTPGTSLSYWYLFKLLANPGDEILCPKPSYPLLDSIAELSGVRLSAYRLLEGSRWTIDFDSLRAAITSKTRAVVLISPHNPTGAVANEEEVRELSNIATQQGLPLISDEVFSAFVFNGKKFPRAAAPLAFTLNGLSKMLAMPGLKLGWVTVTGESSQVKKAMHALDMISDMFLPVNEAIQFALPTILRKGRAFSTHYRKEVQARADLAMAGLANARGISYSRPEGGFYLTVKLKQGADEESLALNFLRRHGIFVHPGYFYDLEGSHLVFSFITSRPSIQAALKAFTTLDLV